MLKSFGTIRLAPRSHTTRLCSIPTASAQDCLAPLCRPIQSFCQNVGVVSCSQISTDSRCLHDSRIIHVNFKTNYMYIYNISLHVNSFQDMVQKFDEDCANQIYWWQKYTQQCKLHHIQKGIYCRPSTGEHMSGWGPQFLKV